MAEGKMKILLVEDNPGDARLIQEMVKQAGAAQYELVVEGTLEGALSSLRKGSFNMVLLDLNLPDSSGIATMKSIQRNASHIALIVITGLSDDAIAIESLKMGAEDFLVKGKFDGSLLVRSLRYAIERKRAGKMLQESREMSHVLFISSREAIMTLEPPSWKFTSCNPATVQMFKVKDEAEFISYEPWVLSPKQQPDGRASDEKAREMIETAMREGFHFFEWTHKRANGEEFLVEVFLTKVEMGGKAFLQANFRDITKRKQTEMALRNIEWMLTKGSLSKFLIKGESQQPYGDITKCNTSRLILDSVGGEMLSGIADDYLDLLDTCTAIYEKNGDYAFGTFTSDWCKFMDEAGRNLCGTQDNKEALSSGKWVCHESCWNEASKVSIENGQPTDIECKGGIHIYAVPIYFGKEIIGSINFGYGVPPKDPQKIKELALLYGVKEEKLFELANSYKIRPSYMIDIAKRRILVSAKLIGYLVERKLAEETLQVERQRLHQVLEAMPIMVCLLTPDYHVAFANRAFREKFGESHGRRCYEYCFGKKEPCDFCETYQVLKTAKPHHWQVTTSDGASVIEVYDFPFTDVDGSPMILEMNIDITERKQAEEALKEAKAFTESTLNSITDIFYSFDLSGKLLSWNKTFNRISGYSDQELSSKTPIDFFSGEDIQRVAEAVERIYKEGTAKVDANFVLKDGRQIPCEFTGSILKDSTGNIIGFSGTSRDLTKRKQAEEELRSSEARFRAIFDNANDGMLLADKETKQFYTGNNTICQMLGYSLEEIKNLRVADIHPKEGLPYVIEQFERQTRKEIAVAENLPVKRKDGSVFYADVNTSLITLAGRTYLLGIFRDITERKKTEDDIRRAKEYAELLLRVIPSAIFTVDANRCITSWNKKAEKLTGFAAEEIMGKECTLFAEKPCRDKCGLYSDDVAKPVIGKECTVIRKDGQQIIISKNVDFLKDEKGNTIGGIESFEDITQRKQAEEELKEAYEELKRTQNQLIQVAKMASIGQLAAGLAHEINNPLTGVLNNVQLIKMEMEQGADSGISVGEFKEVLGAIEESALRCKKITQALLDFSRASKATLQPVLINEMVEKVISLISYELRLQNVIIQTDFSGQLPLIQGNPQLLQQVFMNLITNSQWAIRKKSGTEGGTITIKTEYDSQKDRVNIYFSDAGIGMSSETVNRLFEPFFTTKEIGEGTGLGLSVIYGIIQEHKGTIEVESEVDKGTTFKISLPAFHQKEAV
jgi:PAS domain S-box-containing protein